MSAIISECGMYRYRLDREDVDPFGFPSDWNGRVVWVMLNPSTADAELDDPTIRRCIGFTRSWGYKSLTVVNLFALRSTDPRALATHPAPIGPENWIHISEATDDASLVVAAWGGSYPTKLRGQVLAIAGHLPPDTVCLGRTKAGDPRHPLYVRGDQEPARFWPQDRKTGQ